MPPRGRKAALTKRTAAVLQRLIGGRDNPAGIPRMAVAARLAERRLDENQDQLGPLREYLAGRRLPEVEKSWHLGETLRELGSPWCSGLWMLWVCGHYEDVIATIGTWMRHQDDLPNEIACGELWNMLTHATGLAEPTDLDGLAPFAGFYVHKREMDEETEEALRSWQQAEGPNRPHTDAVATTFTFRERAKTAWRQYGSVSHGMAAAFESWIRQKPSGFKEADEPDILISAMIGLAHADGTIEPTEISMLMLIGSWLNTVESGLGRIMYPRNIALFHGPLSEQDRALFHHTMGPTYFGDYYRDEDLDGN